ncbi:MAG TPA: cytochrome c [Pseudolabrys sp.]|nr:cytochrome c [Pseudolabrys sp.]
MQSIKNLRGTLAALVLCALTGAPAALGQAQTTPPATDTIIARKVLMNAVDRNMDEIETMLAPGGKLESADAREHSDAISVLLQALPHLFPPATNVWKPGVERDPATDTYASPELWDNFADFYTRANAASKIALDASLAKRADEYRALIGQLRAACNGCHAKYQKTE